jgi:hypothetical protein
MAQCPHCYRTIPNDAVKCPHCQGMIGRRRGPVVSAGTPKRRSGPDPATIAAIVVVVLLLVIGGVVLLLVLPRIEQTAAPPQSTAPPATLAPGETPVAPTETPQAAPTSGPTPHPPAGLRQVGGPPEGFVLWVPDTWTIYQAGLDQPDAWINTISAQDEHLAAFFSDEEARNDLSDAQVRLVALNSPQGVEAGQYWPEMVVVHQLDEFAGKQPEDALAALESDLNARYGTRNLKIIGKNTTTIKNVPAARVEYTYERQTPLGSQISVHAARLILISSSAAYEVHTESSHGRYNIVLTQSFTKVVSSFRFESGTVTQLELPAGWHEIRNDDQGFVVWLPDDWTVFNSATDDYNAFTDQVRQSYKQGASYIDAFGTDILAPSSVVAVEPVARQTDSVWLGTLRVYIAPADPTVTARDVEQIILAYNQQHPELNNKIVRNDVIWQQGKAAAYLEWTSYLPFSVEEQITFYQYQVIVPSNGNLYYLHAVCLDHQLDDFQKTFDLVLKSFQVTK